MMCELKINFHCLINAWEGSSTVLYLKERLIWGVRTLEI